MASTVKKNESAVSQMGRPKKGALSSYPAELALKVKAIRAAHQGWGAPSILAVRRAVELEEVHGYSKPMLPSANAINRYLKQIEQTKVYEPRGQFPEQQAKISQAVHALWEIDAQGATLVGGIGYHAMINMKDHRSLKYCMSFPIPVRHQRCQPATVHYQWAFRLAFEESGLPQAIQVDKDSVFYENTTKSPYPSPMHLWWTGLGLQVYFITLPPPLKQARVERSHQTIDRQVIQGQHYQCWKHFFEQANKRRKYLNEKLPCSSLAGKPPLKAYPKALHSGRPFTVGQEHDLFDLDRVYKLLATGVWYRKVSNAKTISWGGHIYYLKKAKHNSQLKITFSYKTRLFIFRDDKELLLAKLPPKGLSTEQIIGATAKELKTMKYKLRSYRDFPLKT